MIMIVARRSIISRCWLEYNDFETGALFTLSFTLTSAPRSINNPTISTWPLHEAKWSEDLPSCGEGRQHQISATSVLPTTFIFMTVLYSLKIPNIPVRSHLFCVPQSHLKSAWKNAHFPNDRCFLQLHSIQPSFSGTQRFKRRIDFRQHRERL